MIAYSEDYQYDGYVPLGNLEKVELVSCRFDDETGDYLIEDVMAEADAHPGHRRRRGGGRGAGHP